MNPHPPQTSSLPSSPVLPNAETSKMNEEERQTHLSFMREALAMAELAFSTNETPVGCIFVHQNTIIGRGMNATNASYNGTRHAEFIAISDILSSIDPEGKKKYGSEVLKECDLYVTVEPCIMCASLLRQFGIRRVFFGAGNEKFGGCGGVLNVHVANGAIELKDEGWDGEEGAEKGRGGRKRHEDDYEVSGGWLREEAILLLRRFYVQENGRAPEPRRRGKEERVVKVDVEPLVEGKKKGG